MSKLFVPFQSFEKSCSNASKPLAESMQENCSDRLAPDVPESCSDKPCPPYWQPSGELRCLSSGLVDIEELDGCGNSRWVRGLDHVIWTDVEELPCVSALDNDEHIYMEQINQCGGTRKVSTGKFCCTPVWTNVVGAPVNCERSGLRVQQENSCGDTRLHYTGQPVAWEATGDVRCQPGNNYQVEQINDCGVTRWLSVTGGCPCIPNWQPTGPQRCTGLYIENYQVDGCNHERWQPTATLVVWSNTGATRCNGNFIQNEQISQCGTTRWDTTAVACTSSPPANELANPYAGAVISGSGKKFMSCKLNAANGLISWGHGNNSGFVEEYSAAWVTGGFDRNHFEARISYTASQVPDSARVRTGNTLDTWFDLGDVTEISHTMTCTQPGFPVESGAIIDWDNILIRIDIRKKGEGISGGCGFGAFKLRAD